MPAGSTAREAARQGQADPAIEPAVPPSTPSTPSAPSSSSTQPTHPTPSTHSTRSSTAPPARNAITAAGWLPALWSYTAPAVLFLVIRGLGLATLALLGRATNTSMTDALTSWDGQWFLSVAANGYDRVPLGLVDAHGTRDASTSLAFFPGYPYLARLADQLPGVGPIAAAIAVAVVAGIVACYAMARLGERLGGDRRTGLLLVVLFAAAPMAIVQTMSYSESLFCALAGWALVGVLERRWLLAGLCTLAAGLVRPTAAALVLAVCLAALVAIVRRRDSWRPWVGGLLAPLGLLGYLGWVGLRTGRLDGWFDLQQRGWDSQFDGGAATLRFTIESLSTSREALYVVTVAILLASLVCVFAGFYTRMPWPLLVYGIFVLFMDLGSNGLMNSKARLLLPAFTLLIPVAIGLAKRRPATVWLGAAGAVVFSCWFGAYALTVWPYAI